VKPKPCPVGKQGIVLNADSHVHVCTPALRSLVRAAKDQTLECEDCRPNGLGPCRCGICMAYRRFEKEKK
jgi:hypothetical protein